MLKKNLKLNLASIGPDNVDEYLAKIRSNRAKTARHTGSFVRLIKRGYFRDGGIIFIDSKGKVQDGQHRLYALKQTGHTASFWVLIGLDAQDLNMMLDSGKKRSNSARVGAAGYASAPTLVAAIEEIIDLKDQWRQKADMIMIDEIWAFLHEHKEIVEITKAWVEAPIADIKIAYLVSFYFLFGQIEAQKNDQFFNALRLKATQPVGHPVRAFHEMLQTETVRKTVEDGKTAVYNRFVRNGLIIAWNAFFKGVSLNHIEPTVQPITLEGTPATGAPEPEEPNGSTEIEPAEAETETVDENTVE